MKTEELQLVGVRLPKRDLVKLQKIAREKRSTVSQVIREFLADRIKEEDSIKER